MKWDIEMNFEKFELSLQWVIDLFTRILSEVFGFIAEEEKWEDAE